MPLGPWELAIILLIVIIIFGVGKLPQIGGALGQGIREFRTSATSPDDDNDEKAAAAERDRVNHTAAAPERERIDNDSTTNQPVTVVKDNEER